MNVMISMMQADKTNKKEILEMLQCKPERPTTASKYQPAGPQTNLFLHAHDH